MDIPLGLFVCITGVSGSGKSTLLDEIIYKGLAHKLHRARAHPGDFQEMLGIEHLDKVIKLTSPLSGALPGQTLLPIQGLLMGSGNFFL